MKFFILTIALLAAIPAQGQITLEHTYPPLPQTLTGFELIQVDSSEWKYVFFHGSGSNTIKDTIVIYNLDHSLEQMILVRNSEYTNQILGYIAKHLFTNDSSYAYLIKTASEIAGVQPGLRILKSDGSSIFSCDSCSLLGYNFETGTGLGSAIQNTSSGAKMIIYAQSIGIQVYSLPGRLPSGQQMLSVGGSSSPANALSIPSMAYPNPSSGRVRIAYDLPGGTQSGDVVLTSVDGRELKRYHITSAFSDLLIEASDLPSGSYFYKVVTDKGESAAQRIVRE